VKILGLDVETTGLDSKVNKITEIAWGIYETEDFSKPFAARSFVIKIDEEIPDLIVQLTGITQAHVASGDKLVTALTQLLMDIQNFDIKLVVAHNGQFDMDFLREAFNSISHPVPQLELIDSAKDIPFPKEITTRTLRFLAVEHGFMNPFPHSAIFDVFCMMKVLACYSFDDVLTYKREPTYIISADVNYNTKDPAKKAGFRWQELDGNFYEKTWVKAVKKRHFDEEVKTYSFGYRILSEK